MGNENRNLIDSMPDYLQEAGPRDAEIAALWANPEAFAQEWNFHKLGSSNLPTPTPNRSGSLPTTVLPSNFEWDPSGGRRQQYEGLQITDQWLANGGVLNSDADRAAYFDLLWEEEERKRKEDLEALRRKFDRDMADLGGVNAGAYHEKIAGMNASTAAFQALLGNTVEARRLGIDQTVDPLEQAELVAWLKDAQAHDLGTPEDLRDAFDLGTNMLGVRKQSGDAKAIEDMAAVQNARALAEIIAQQDYDSSMEEEYERVATLVGEMRSEEAEVARDMYERQTLEALASAQAAHAEKVRKMQARYERDIVDSVRDTLSRDEWDALQERELQMEMAKAAVEASERREASMIGAAQDIAAIRREDVANGTAYLNAMDPDAFHQLTGLWKAKAGDSEGLEEQWNILKYAATQLLSNPADFRNGVPQ